MKETIEKFQASLVTAEKQAEQIRIARAQDTGPLAAIPGSVPSEVGNLS